MRDRDFERLGRSLCEALDEGAECISVSFRVVGSLVECVVVSRNGDFSGVSRAWDINDALRWARNRMGDIKEFAMVEGW